MPGCMPCRSSRRTWWRRPTICAVAWDTLPAHTDGEPEIVGKLRDGFEGVERSFLSLLERNGIARVDATGKPFDANLHQAMAEQPSSEHPPGTVIQAWTAGWTLNGRLLRPAMVVVSKAAPEAG